MTREKLAELEKELKSREASHEVRLMLQLVEAYIDRAKEHLTTSDPTTTPWYQGEIKGLRAIQQVFTRTKLPTQPL